ALEKENARGMKELGDVTRERSAAGHGPAQTPAEGGVELREDELVGDLALELERGGPGRAAPLVAAPRGGGGPTPRPREPHHLKLFFWGGDPASTPARILP